MAGDVVFFGIDRSQMIVGMGWILDNLAQVFCAATDRMLELVVDLRWPVFEEGVATPASSSCPRLKTNQVLAIEKVLSVEGYVLVYRGQGRRQWWRR